MNRLLLLVLALSMPLVMVAKDFTISGKVIDNLTGEPLYAANVIYETGKGTTTDMEGNYVLKLPEGTYNLTVSYVGYETKSENITLQGKNIEKNFALKTKMLQDFQVTADVAKVRETPVAFSTIPITKLEEELASQDIPMILNNTPGVYATQQGGGDGDARINIRGFNQRNIAVMIDGIPVNDMENGWVYWSNWFGLDMVTRSIQVQRGLGASKLAIPSVGGTMNILTKGIESRRLTSLKQEIGSDGFMRTSLGFNSGRLKNGWGITAAASYKQGDGYVDMAWTQGWFYYFKVEKEIGNHIISLTGMGAPQEHGQRSYKSSIAEYDAEYANSLGIDSADFVTGKPTSLGMGYNPNWGYLDRNGDGNKEKLNVKKNFYHKPQFSLRDFWRVNDKLHISNIAYLSIGNGGGTGLTSTPNLIVDGPEAGLVNFQNIYDNNVANNSNPQLAGKGEALYAGVNNHFWYGLLSTASYDFNKYWELSGGIDLRSYKGEHYREVYDLLGADYYIDKNEDNALEVVNKTTGNEERILGDRIGYNNDGLVRWGGLFGQAEYKKDKWSTFINVSVANTSYKRVDYFKKKDLVLDDTVLAQAVGYSRVFDMNQGGFVVVQDTLTYEGKQYTSDSEEARYSETEWKSIYGFTVKAGANYNFTKNFNAFANIGFISKAPRFNNVFDYDNRLYKNIENEQVQAFELGATWFNDHVTVNLNGYITKWLNKPADYAPTIMIDDVIYKVNINGVDALHQGVEAEIGYRIMPGLISETVFSLGDWIWNSEDSARIENTNTGEIVDVRKFDARGIYVGDAAQLQLRQSIRWEYRKKLYLNAGLTYFGKNYAQFDPLDLDPDANPWAFEDDGSPRQSWQIPDYFLVDVHAGYKFKINKVNLNFRVSVLNLLDQRYISDASNNDEYSGQNFNDFDAKSASVFFGLGRRINTSLKISF